MGRKGKGKGKNAAPVDMAEPVTGNDYKQAIARAVPPEALRRTYPLLGGQWSADIKLPWQLTASGGISYVRKADVPETLARVAYTLQPTAIVTSQPASELHLPGYRSQQTMVELQVWDAQEPKTVLSKKWITQISFGKAVVMEADGPEFKVVVSTTRMVAKLVQDDLFLSTTITPKLVSSYLLDNNVPPEYFSDMLGRDVSVSFPLG